MMRYKGYVGVVRVDTDAGVIRGEVVNVRDTITFQGATPAEARKAFEESVDDYLEFCESLGRQPEKPFSGKILVRVDPEVQRDLTALARAHGVSVNTLITEHLKRITQDCPLSLGDPPIRAEIVARGGRSVVSPTRTAPKERRTNKEGRRPSPTAEDHRSNTASAARRSGRKLTKT